MEIKKFILTLIVLVAFSANLLAQGEGCYFVKNHNHREYDGASQSWAITQDKRGIIYIANNVGVIEYDGNDWRYISINQQLARCLDVDNQGRIWVGAQDEIGYLAADSTNNLVYHSLVSLLPQEYQPLGLVRQVYCDSNCTYFNTNDLLVRISFDKKVKIWKPKTTFHRSYFVNNTLFINQRGYGLTYLADDSVICVKNCPQFSNTPIYTMLAYDESQILIGTQSDGFYLFDFKAAKTRNGNNSDEILKPFKTSDDNFFKKNWVYSGALTDSGNFAIGTYRGGVAFFDKNGVIKRHVNRENGLQDDAVWFLYADSQDGLWIALNNGISYTPTKTGLSFWSSESGISGVTQSVERLKGRIYVSTNSGVYRNNGEFFEPLDDLTGLCWGLITIDDKNCNHLLISSTSGIYVTDNTKVSFIEGGEGVHPYQFIKSKYYPNIIYAGMSSGVGVISYDNGVFKYLGLLNGSSGQVFSVVEDAEGDIWYSHRFKGVYYIDVVNPYQLVSELPVMYEPYRKCKFDDLGVSIIDGQIYASAESGLSRFDNKTKTFVPDSLLGGEFYRGEKSLKIFGQDRFGSIWFESYNLTPNRRLQKAVKTDDGTYRLERNLFDDLPMMINYDVMVEPDGVALVTATDGLFRCDNKIVNRCDSVSKILIRNVIANKKMVYNGVSSSDIPSLNYVDKQPDKQVLRLKHGHNSIQFQYTMVALWQQQQVQYSCKLEGYEVEWNEWSDARIKEYTNLPFGSYDFLVKARFIDGRECSTASYKFTIAKPWYMRWYSFIACFVLLALLAILLTRINSRRYRIQNIRLQNLVDERTEEVVEKGQILLEKNAELELQKEEILSQRDELATQNKRINDSIQYAKTIQQAVLPDIKQMLTGIAEHFLINLPRDLVSGDFYWASQIEGTGKRFETTIVAVVDCTGHGVPGAFMSLIGSRLLNEIVNERKVYNPAEILTQLAESVKQALHQDTNDSFDGMDLAICSIERKVGGLYMVTFAGANRPLYYYIKDDVRIQAIRGNRKSIGEVLPDVDKEYKNWVIPMHRGDMLIMCTDGIADQNCNQIRKYTANGLTNSILEVITKPMSEIASNVLGRFDEFKQNEPQRDDVTVLGIRFL